MDNYLLGWPLISLESGWC